MRIESYSFGRIEVEGKQYDKDLVIFPESIRSNWRRKSGHMLGLEDIEDILENQPDVLVIGTGAMGLMKVGEDVRHKLDSAGIEYTIAKTKDAVQEYNKVSGDKKAVFAAHLTC